MALGIIIHISVGSEKRTEFFSEDRLSIGSDETCDLQIHTNQLTAAGVWLSLENADGVSRIVNFDPSLELTINEKPIRRFIAIADGDVIRIDKADISFTFLKLAEKPSLISTKRTETQVAKFISEAALDAAASPERDDAKAFLREFTRELMREISWTSKAITLVLALGFISGILYLGYAVNAELQANRIRADQQKEIITNLEEKLGTAGVQLDKIQETNKDLLRSQSLMQNVRVEYGNGICLIVGVYDLVDRATGKVLRYPDPQSFQQVPYEPVGEGDSPQTPGTPGQLTTLGGGSPVEYDFIGTGFHVGNGYIVTNRHVVQPWGEDDLVKAMIRDNNGRARLKRLVIYFPNIPQPFPIKVIKTNNREDVAVAQVEGEGLPIEVPWVPLDSDSMAATVGKTVVTMGYPNGPDRLIAMVDDDEANSLNRRFGNSRQNLINFLAQSKKIVPLTTQGAITDLDSRRIVHDARTAEGGSGAPLFGQTGKVIGVNFGVFTQNTAVNMAVPIRFAIDLLVQTEWKPPDEMPQPTPEQNANGQAAQNTTSPK